MSYQKLFSGFSRLGNFPLDPSGIHLSLVDANTYIKTNRTAYEGQVIAVIADIDENNNGVYVVRRNGEELELVNSVNITKVRAEIKAAIDVLNSELRAEDAKLGQELREYTNTARSEIEASITNVQTELNNKDEQLKGLIEALESTFIADGKVRDEQHEELSNRISDLVSKLNILENEEDLTNGLNSIAEISQWLNEHKGEFEFLQTKLDQDLSDLEAKVTGNMNKIADELRGDDTKLDERITAIEEHGATNEEEVRGIATEVITEVLGSGSFRTVDKNIVLDLDDFSYGAASIDENGVAYFYKEAVAFKSGDIIKVVTVKILKPADIPQEEFEVFVTYDNGNREVLIPSKVELGEDFNTCFDEAGNPLREYVKSVDLSAPYGTEYGFELNYEIPSEIEGTATKIENAYLGIAHVGVVGAKVRVIIEYFSKE